MRPLIVLGIAILTIGGCSGTRGHFIDDDFDFVIHNSGQQKPQPLQNPNWEFCDELIDSNLVHVFVSKSQVGGSVVYNYRVLNRHHFPVSALAVGLDAFKYHGELPAQPQTF